MNTQAPASLMYEILKLGEEINDVAKRLNSDGQGVFDNLSLRMPSFVPAELGFLRMVSWLYVLYQEAGGVNVDFLSERLPVYDLDPDGKLHRHLGIVQELRTFLQHNLDPGKTQNRQIQENCERWFRSQCNTPVPAEEEQWNRCLIGLLNEALEFLKALRNCIRDIEQDESCEQIIHEWDFRRKRYHPAHEFDELIARVGRDMGRESIEPVRLRKRFYDKWVKELDLLRGNYSFNIEARKLIEHALLVETTPVLPITGDDIMRVFGLEPGPQVGMLLKRAQLIYDSEPCSSEALLEKLRQKLTDDV